MGTIHLYSPGFLAVEILPDPYRSKLADLLEKNITHEIFKTHPLTQIIHDYMSSMIAILRDDRSDENEFYNYIKFTADYDRRTGIIGH